MKSFRILLIIFASALPATKILGQLTTENYIKTFKATIPLTGDLQTINDKNKVVEVVSYVDGLGRPTQTVMRRNSSLGYDVVSFQTFDEYGRVTKSFLPYPTTATDGSSKGSMVANQSAFYQGLVGASDGANAFSIARMEDSELSRILKQGAPGLSWQPDATNTYSSTDRTIKYSYGSNDASEVLLWTFLPPTEEYTTTAVNAYGKVNAGTAAAPVYYAAGKLSKKKTKDEEGNQVIEYSDLEGRTILKRVQVITGSPSTTDTNKDVSYASTYYIYNDLGNLVCVIPPEATTRLVTEYLQAGATDATKNDFLKRWAFRYRYDGRSRMILKQIPGAEPVFQVYDNRDRLILTQDGNQRAGATNTIKYWSFTKYDQLNRPVLTGIKDTTTSIQLTQGQMQTAVNNHFAKVSAKWSETYVGNTTGNVHGYTNKAYPVRTGSTTTEIDPNKYLSVTYYDTYDFRSLWYGTYNYLNESLNETINGITYNQPANENLRVVGQVTGTKTKVLDGGVTGGYTWLKGITYYDDKYRVLQVLSDNYKGGIDRVTNVVDFVGKVLKTKSTHVEADITWKDQVTVTQVGNKLIRTNAGGAWNAGAASVQQLSAAQSGWLEVTVPDVNSHRMIGFSNANPDASYNSIGFAWYIYESGGLQIYESGANRGNFGTYSAGDFFRIERTGTVIKYFHNNILKYTSTVSSSSLLMADVSIYTGNGSIVGVRSSFSTTTKTITRKFEYDHAGRLLKTWHQLDGGPNVLVALNEYNELGQLVDKKLHSTVSTGANAKQSVDYRYNIRGWLTKMNESDVYALAPGDVVKDYFGFELAYNNDLGTGNVSSLQYNGNISAMKWSNSLSLGTVKENAYNYTYDPLNRIKTSTFKELNGSWTAPANSRLTETGFSYDLNGNILALQRNDKRASGWMDNLVYNYGTGATRSNKLLRVDDIGDDFAGFVDGNPTAATDFTTANDDYRYDANGNMINDRNKGIGTSISDNTNIITYSFLNLPETITKGGNSIRYIYDATGRKLSQVTTFGGQQKQVDYAGEFQYENDALQFISHEEGRIAIANNKTIVMHSGDAVAGITAVTSTLAPVTQNSGQTYIRATAVGTTTKQGMFPIGGTLAVQAGEQYRIRVKGYRTANNANQVHLYIRTNSTDLNWPGAQLPKSDVNATNESYVEQVITIPTGHTTLQAGVVWNTVAAGEQFFLNDFEITKLTTSATPEYQYNLKDHLGNVRLSFTSKEEVETTTATLETANMNVEQSQFLRYANAKRIQSSLFDRTNGIAPTTTTGYSVRLNGSANELYGLARSLSVMPGDVINTEVYYKYIDPAAIDDGTPAGQAVLALLGQIAAGAAGVVVDGALIGSSTSSFPASYAGLVSRNNNGSPRAYLNWLVFDRNFGFITGGFKQIETAGKETGTDVPHGFIASPNITITQPGYVYIYLSNESMQAPNASSTPIEVYFDDFKVTHTKSSVIQIDDYYPFGLAFNSYQKENGTPNEYMYQGKELQEELNLGAYDFEFRFYEPALGRTFQIDPLADWFYDWSPYSWAGNNPMLNIDPTGQDWYAFTNENGVVTTIWQKGDAEKVEIDGTIYNNIGTSFTQTLDDGTQIHYDQNEVVNVVENTDQTVARQPYEFGKDFDVQYVEERTNKVINEEIKNFAKSLVGLGDPEKGPVWDVPISPFDKNPASKNLGARKGNNKNSKHANEKRREQARQNYDQSKKEYEELKSKPNKTPEDKKKLEQAKRKMEHHKQQMDFTGENHSQTGKGN